MTPHRTWAHDSFGRWSPQLRHWLHRRLHDPPLQGRGLCASLFFKNQDREFSGALLGPLVQSLFSARVPIAPAPHSFWFSMPYPIRQIRDASDIGTTRRQRCRAQFPLPPICKLDISPSPTSLMWVPHITIRLSGSDSAIRSSIHACRGAHRRSLRRVGVIEALGQGTQKREICKMLPTVLIDQPWQSFDTRHELTRKGIEKFAADYRATLSQTA